MSTPVTISAGTAPPVTLGSPPAPRSGPAPRGLYSTTVDPDGIDSHWANSVLWEHQSCAAASGVNGTCGDFNGIPRSTDNQSVQAVAQAFHAYGSHTCNPVGYTADELFVYARRNLLDHEQELAESAISSGNQNTLPTFAGATDLTPTAGTAVSLAHGFGLLSSYAAAVFGSPGSVIHAPRVVSGYAANLPLADFSPTVTTVTGEKVSFGAGYENLDPVGTPAADGEAWLYVTPPVFLLQSELRDYDTMGAQAALDRANNDYTTLAERTILVGWDDCPVAGVLVSLNGA